MTPELMANLWMGAFGLLYGTVLVLCCYWNIYLPLKSEFIRWRES